MATPTSGPGSLQCVARPRDLQADLFQPATAGDPKIMGTLDRINRRFGRGSIGFAATGWQEKAREGMRQQQLSPVSSHAWWTSPRVIADSKPYIVVTAGADHHHPKPVLGRESLQRVLRRGTHQPLWFLRPGRRRHGGTHEVHPTDPRRISPHGRSLERAE